MKKLITLIFASFCLLLVGCQTTPKVEYVKQYEQVLVVLEPPREFYSKPKRIKPPVTKQYVDATWEEKEAMLFGHITELNKQITSLVTDRESLDTWVTQQKVLVKEKKAQK